MKIKLKYWIISLIIVVSLYINYDGFMQGTDWGDDFAGYVIQSQTLKSGDFKSLEEHMSHNDFVLNYPWGFPIVLMPVINHFQNDILYLKKYIYFFLVLGFLFVYLLFYKYNKEYALLAIALCSVSPYFWHFKNYILSDFPNLCFTISSLVLIDKLIIRKEKLVNVYLDNCLMGATIFMSFIMRSQSFVLLLTLATMQIILHKREILKPKTLLTLSIPYLFFFLLKFGIEIIIPIKSVSYTDAYKNVAWFETIGNNFFYYIIVWKELFAEILFLKKIDGIITGVCLLLFLIGIFKSPKENLLLLIFIFYFMSLLLITPFYQGLRYAMPLIPIVFYFVINGIHILVKHLHSYTRSIIAYSFLGHICFTSLYSIAMLNNNNTKNPILLDGPYTPKAIEMFNFLKSKTHKESIIGYWKPRAMLLYSGRNGVVPHDYQECLNKNVGYYVYYNNAYLDQISLENITSQPEHFKLEFQNNDFKVYKVLSELEFYYSTNKNSKEGNHSGILKIIGFNYFPKNDLNKIDGDSVLTIWEKKFIEAKPFELSAGDYELNVFGRGTSCEKIFPHLNIYINDNPLGSYDMTNDYALSPSFHFKLNNSKTISIKLLMDNDKTNLANKEDRNAFVKAIYLNKK